MSTPLYHSTPRMPVVVSTQAASAVTREQVIDWLDGEDISVTNNQMDRLFCAPAPVAPTQEESLIEWEDAHNTAWQAAAAFRPPYFGDDFRAHNWVVEAIRSAHIDGQWFAKGLSKISRARGGELPQELRAQRAAPAPVAPRQGETS